MNHKKIVRLTNVIGMIAITMLVYWVFIFMVTEVFHLRVFRESITQTFQISVFGILALMAGALMINIMFNLTRIAQKQDQSGESAGSGLYRKLFISFLLSFPLILGLLIMGDRMTSAKKERIMVDAARSIVEGNKEKANVLVNYSFNRHWMKQVDSVMDILSNTDKNFPAVSVIVRDTIARSQVWLSFSRYNTSVYDTLSLNKVAYMMSTEKAEREYFDKVFNQDYKEIRYVVDKGNYILFYPYSVNGKTIILHFSDYLRYGK